MNRPRRVSELRNIGTLIASRLHEIGVDTEEDLRSMGAVEAHRRIKDNYPDKTLSVCYYLYSFEAALRDIHWDDLSNLEKEALKKKASE
ncbi:TfoX/Sxy family protein [Rubellicoccus peritrichatus]|uniref:TfoX/Sxy family protein n=1 Tax=Rubellicoccus peritrichatus TaxID=3080537 RepID=A0AAQ3LCW6_9BACT|nr:TfoX/Sxy family protein [Puniceicoccus sp. CR14]WOO43077.1 TfoX/Sxy family protein [Puniceicoccus sp. CR14]